MSNFLQTLFNTNHDQPSFLVFVVLAFIAIVVPVAKQSRAVLGVVALAVALSCAMHWVPVLNTVSSGFSIILCTVLAAGLGALAAPVPDEPSGAPDGEVA